jgi:hypothetical protein
MPSVIVRTPYFWCRIVMAGGPSYREAKGGDIQLQPFWQARDYVD